MIEIQIHPSDIRRKVRYLFFGRRMVLLGIVMGLLLLAFTLASMAAAPSVIRRTYRTSYLRVMKQERAIQRQRLSQYMEQMSSLEQTLDSERLAIEKLVTVYGLQHTALGQGGLPASVRSAPGHVLELADARLREQQLRHSVQTLQDQLETLIAYESANAKLIRHIPSILPLPAEEFVLTSPFGDRISPFTRKHDFHKGLDLAAPVGTPIFASADGVVTFAGRYPLSRSVAWWRFGNVVVVNHADRFITIYAHCNETRVRKGQTVRQGDVIATVGSTGWSTNSHLHYEIRSDLEKPGEYRPIDPRIYILNHHWNDEENLLIQSRTSPQYEDFDPLPTAFIGRRSV